MRVATLLLLLCAPAVVLGHAFMKEPITRNMIHDVGGCPHCGNAKGTSSVGARITSTGFNYFPDNYNPTTGTYAEGTHGLCGDPWQTAAGDFTPITTQPMMVPTEYTAVYTEGGIIEIQVAVSTHHAGFVQFSICNFQLDQSLESQEAGQRCLDMNVLERVPLDAPERNGECFEGGEPVSPNANVDCAPLDPTYPGRFYLPPNDLMQGDCSYPYYTMKYRLPDGLTCGPNAPCTMQYWYYTANSCHPPGELDWYKNVLYPNYPEATNWAHRAEGMSTCNVNAQTEQFWNCADIVILAAGQTADPPSITDSCGGGGGGGGGDGYNGGGGGYNNLGGCVDQWQGCGSAAGHTCCSTAGNVCYEKDDYYYQCRPEGDCPPAGEKLYDPVTAPNGWRCNVMETDAPEDPDEPETPDVEDPDVEEPDVEEPETPDVPEPDVEDETPVEDDEPFTGQIDGCFQSGYLPAYGNCTGQHSGCCADGELCYTVDSTYSQCRAPGTCPDCTWECEVVPEPCPAIISKYGNCRESHCCAEGLVCYEQDAGYAQCLPPGACPECETWSCNALVHGLYDGGDAVLRRRRNKGLRRDPKPAAPAARPSAPSFDAEAAEAPSSAEKAHDAQSKRRSGAVVEEGEALAQGSIAGMAGSAVMLVVAGVLLGKARSDFRKARRLEEGEPMLNP